MQLYILVPGMGIRFVLLYTMVSLAFITLYKPEIVLSIAIAATEQREEIPADTQEETENERQLEEKVLLTQVSALLPAGNYSASYFLKNVRIPITLPIPLHEPPPNTRC